MSQTTRREPPKGITSVGIETRTNPYTGEPEFAVYGYGTYDRWSVLAGQQRRLFLDSYPTREAAIAAWPEAGEGQGNAHEGETLEEISGLSSEPPSDFDPMDAGERWDSDY